MKVDSLWQAFTALFDAELMAALLMKAIWIVVIIAVALLVRWLLHFVIDRVVRQVVSGAKKKQNVADTQALAASPLATVRLVQRARTLGSVLTNIVNVLIFIVSVLAIVQTISSAILGSFAILTAAIGAGLGFGAQNIVKDVLNGLFMVVEDQVGVGDVVDLGSATGVVEEVGIRITKVRDVDGTLWFVRNGEILRTGNMSQGWARVIVDLPIPYTSDVEAVQAELLESAAELANTPAWRHLVLEKPEIWGLETISAEALVTRLVVKTRVSAKWDFARALRLHLKQALDGMGTSLTPLNAVVMTGMDGATAVEAAAEAAGATRGSAGTSVATTTKEKAGANRGN